MGIDLYKYSSKKPPRVVPEKGLKQVSNVLVQKKEHL
jgi:hypothetical protein